MGFLYVYCLTRGQAKHKCVTLAREAKARLPRRVTPTLAAVGALTVSVDGEREEAAFYGVLELVYERRIKGGLRFG